MTLAEAIQQSNPGDFLRHTGAEVIILRKDTHVETICQLKRRFMLATQSPEWEVVRKKKSTGRGAL